jgi:hypothetical protein
MFKGFFVCSNSMNGWLAKRGRSRGAHHGLLRRRIMGSALKPSFWQLSRKGNGKSGPDIIFCCLASCKMREQSMLKYMYESMAQCRLNLLAKAQNRLAKLDELRQAAKNDVEMRFEKEREELETRVESRVRQAEENRMRLLHAHMQKRAALKERIARSLVQKAASESNYMEQVRSAMLQKRTAAERKRLRLLEAERMKAQARLLRIQRAAMTVCSQRETERRKLKEQLDNKLQRVFVLNFSYY